MFPIIINQKHPYLNYGEKISALSKKSIYFKFTFIFFQIFEKKGQNKLKFTNCFLV